MLKNPKKMTAAEYLRWLCNFYVTGCVAIVSEISPGTEYFDETDADVLIQHLKQTPELTGVIIDGGASVRNPDILNDKVVFFNRTEEEVLKQLEEVPSHE